MPSRLMDSTQIPIHLCIRNASGPALQVDDERLGLFSNVTAGTPFAEKTSRLMSPFSKDETGHES